MIKIKLYRWRISHVWSTQLSGSNFRQIRMWNQEFMNASPNRSLAQPEKCLRSFRSAQRLSWKLKHFSYDAVSTGKYIPPFRSIILTPNSGRSRPIRNGLFMYTLFIYLKDFTKRMQLEFLLVISKLKISKLGSEKSRAQCCLIHFLIPLMSVRDTTSNLVTKASIPLICLLSCGTAKESFTN